MNFGKPLANFGQITCSTCTRSTISSGDSGTHGAVCSRSTRRQQTRAALRHPSPNIGAGLSSSTGMTGLSSIGTKILLMEHLTQILPRLCQMLTKPCPKFLSRLKKCLVGLGVGLGLVVGLGKELGKNQNPLLILRMSLVA